MAASSQGHDIGLARACAGDPRLAGTLGIKTMTWTLDCGEFMVVATPQPAAPQPTFAWAIIEADRHGSVCSPPGSAVTAIVPGLFAEAEASGNPNAADRQLSRSRSRLEQQPVGRHTAVALVGLGWC